MDEDLTKEDTKNIKKARDTTLKSLTTELTSESKIRPILDLTITELIKFDKKWEQLTDALRITGNPAWDQVYKYVDNHLRRNLPKINARIAKNIQKLLE